jgi:hypothetical protein
MTKGWRFDGVRHSLAAKGIKSSLNRAQKNKFLHQLSRDAERNRLARAMQAAGAIGGMLAGAEGALATNQELAMPVSAVAGGFGGMALGEYAFRKLPKGFRKRFAISEKREEKEEKAVEKRIGEDLRRILPKGVSAWLNKGKINFMSDKQAEKIGKFLGIKKPKKKEVFK